MSEGSNDLEEAKIPKYDPLFQKKSSNLIESLKDFTADNFLKGSQQKMSTS